MEKTKIIVTVDFFHRDWHLPTGELWLFVRPLVKLGPLGDAHEYDELQRWIVSNSTGRPLFDYDLAQCSEHSEDAEGNQDRFIHVNFCSDTNLRLVIDRENQDPVELYNDRLTGPIIIDAPGFRILNRPDINLPQSNEELHRNPVDINSGPFACSYNTAIYDALYGKGRAQGVSIADLAAWLDMGLSGGTRMWINGNVAEPDTLDKVQLMSVPSNNDERGDSTNLHCLNGLGFKLGTKINIDQLKSIMGLKIKLEDRNGEICTLDLGGTPNSKKFLEDYFKALGDLDQEMPKAVWHSDAQAKIYIVDIPQALAASQSSDQTWFKFGQPAGTGNANSSSARKAFSLRRLAVRHKDLSSINRSNLPDKLEYLLWPSYPASLVIYRRFPYPNGTKRVLLHLVTTADGADLWDELEKSRPFVLLNDKDEQINLEIVGLYNLPWDRIDEPQDSKKTLLFLYEGDAVPLGAVRVLIQAMRITANRKTLTPGNPSVEWEWFRPEDWKPEIEFIERLSLESTGIDPKSLVPAVYFDDDVQFRPATTASRFEGVLEVIYERPSDLGDGCQVTPKDNLLDDLVNFNGLNIFKTWQNGSREYVNRNKETYPIFSNACNDCVPSLIKQSYYFGGNETIEPPIDANLQEFYRSLYAKIGNERLLDFDLEHTYGLRLVPKGDSCVSTKTPFDWPPVLPCGIQFKDRPDDPPEKARTFLTVCYVGGKDGEAETATLIFDLEVLRSGYIENHPSKANNKAHQLAWQTVAELRYADEIVLVARGRRFNFKNALKNQAQGVAGGIQDVEMPHGGKWDHLKGPVQELCRKLLSSEDGIDNTVSLELTAPNDKDKLFKVCHVMEFRLQIKRRENSVPDLPAQGAELVTPIIEPCADGVRFLRTDHPMAERTYEQWRETILRAESSITPVVKSDDTKRFRELLRESGEWFVPQGLATPDEGQVVPSMIPFGFLPLAEYPGLGHQTDTALRHYLIVLQLVLDCSVVSWVDRKKNDWAKHFENLQNVEREVTGLMEKLARVLMRPLPDPNDKDLESEIEIHSALKSLRDPNNHIYEILALSLRKQPALFSSSKAFLYTQLRADGKNLPRDLFSMVSQKKIDNALTDKGLCSYADGFQFPLEATDTLGFLEALDDLVYDNEFEVGNFKLESFEGEFDHTERRPKFGSIPIANNLLYLPGGIQHLRSPGLIPPKVFLASRAPVKAPILVWSGHIGKCQDQDWQISLKKLSNIRMRAGELISTTNTKDTLEPVGFGWSGNRSERMDDYIATFIYEIHADEEASGQFWTNAFQNDSIRLYLESDELDGPAHAKADQQMTLSVPDFILSILDGKPLVSRADLGDFIENDLLKFVTEQLIRPAESPKLPTTNPVAKIHLCTPNQLDQHTQFDVNVSSTDISLIEALILRPNVEKNDLFYILVNLQLPVWHRYRLKLVHTRNVEPNCVQSDPFEMRRCFAQEFGNLREQESPSGYVSWSIENEVLKDPVCVPREMTTTQLIELVLVTPGILPRESSSKWKNYRLVVSVYHEQLEVIQVATADNLSGSEETNGVSYAKFLLQREIAPEEDLRIAYEWFADPYLDFSVTFQWFSVTNRCFLTLERRRVKVALSSK